MWRRSSRILLGTFHRLAQLIYADVQSAGESCFKLLSLVLPLRLTLEGMSRWQTGGGNNTRRGYAEHQDRCAYDETCFQKVCRSHVAPRCGSRRSTRVPVLSISTSY
jgi:hypothetical protein